MKGARWGASARCTWCDSSQSPMPQGAIALVKPQTWSIVRSMIPMECVSCQCCAYGHDGMILMWGPERRTENVMTTGDEERQASLFWIWRKLSEKRYLFSGNFLFLSIFPKVPWEEISFLRKFPLQKKKKCDAHLGVKMPGDWMACKYVCHWMVYYGSVVASHSSIPCVM